MIYIFYFLLFVLTNIIIYDKFIQRKRQLLINYPLIGRFRYILEALREPLRQYFAEEDFYESKDKIDWVYNASYDKDGYISFSPNQRQPNPKFLIKHSNFVYNDDEVSSHFTTTIGAKRPNPWTTNSIICRSAMSDGALSPEATKAYTKAAFDGRFPINTGEGGLTTNFFFTHREFTNKYMDIISLSKLDIYTYLFIALFINHYTAIRRLKSKHIKRDEIDTYIFNKDDFTMYRPAWNKPLENFPKIPPTDMPDIIYQLSSGLYGSRDTDGKFCDERYQKTMAFCKATEIKLAQGAKQTGGKLVASKVTPSIAYFRGIKPHQNIFSPNRFDAIQSVEDLFDFVAKLQKLSKKPVGIKIVISSKDGFKQLAYEMKRRDDNGLAGVPDFLSIDGGDGGSATAPLYLMDRVGLDIKDAIHIANTTLTDLNLRDQVKIIASSKILTPDDIVVKLSLGADMVGIGRGFMLSAGCIRAKMCSGEGKHNCPIGLATQNISLRRSYLIRRQAIKIRNYHKNLLKGLKVILAIMGKKSVDELHSDDLTFVDKNGFIHSDINRYLDKKVGKH